MDGYPADSVRILNRGITVTFDSETVVNHVITHIFIPYTPENLHGVSCKCRSYISATNYLETPETAHFQVQGI